MSVRSALWAGLLAGLLSCGASAGVDPAHDHPPLRAGDYDKLYRTLFFAARTGDPEKQERLADFLLGPHGRKVKAPPYEGTRFLFQAAIGGRPAAMRHLAAALDKGTTGLRKLPAAAACWSAMPAGFEQRLACVRLTEFRDPRARPSCTDLIFMRPDGDPARNDGRTVAKLCLANRTAAILVPGLPPGPPTLYRMREYKRHGIEWAVTGDVYQEEFERFRDAFNRTMSDAIDAERGEGHLERLSKEIDARVEAKYVKSTSGHAQ